MLSNCYVPKVIDPVGEDGVKVAQEASRKEPAAIDPHLSLGVIRSPGVVGSASYFDREHSKILCSVMGPFLGSSSSTSLEGGTFECEVQFAPFLRDSDIFRVSRSEQITNHEKYLSQLAKDALESSLRLEMYPKGTIKLQVIILQSSSNDLSGIINCGALALADASMELKDMVSSSSITFRDESKENSPPCTFTLSYLKSLNSISHADCRGRISPQTLSECIQRCQAGCEVMRAKMDEVLIEKLSKHLRGS